MKIVGNGLSEGVLEKACAYFIRFASSHEKRCGKPVKRGVIFLFRQELFCRWNGERRLREKMQEGNMVRAISTGNAVYGGAGVLMREMPRCLRQKAER